MNPKVNEIQPSPFVKELKPMNHMNNRGIKNQNFNNKNFFMQNNYQDKMSNRVNQLQAYRCINQEDLAYLEFL